LALKISGAVRGSIAQNLGIKTGDVLLQINGEDVIDPIDYQALTAVRQLDILTLRGGREKLYRIEKNEHEPLGILSEDAIASSPRLCGNRCIFCFIDQMPPSLRSTLYVKDDDWRLSLIMGNYITLTNMDESEFSRLIKRRASPLYISVHATVPEVRHNMMRNAKAGEIMRQLTRLCENGLSFHCQIVLCPGVNDGDVLRQTLQDLAGLYPSAKSAALVPAGLTRYRENLTPLQAYAKETARALLDSIIPMQERFLASLGTRFAFPSDEFYCLCGAPLPDEAVYEDFPQLENGVGLLRLLESELEDARGQEPSPPMIPAGRLIACGVSAAPFMERLIRIYAPHAANLSVRPIHNLFFGSSVTVTGLITGGDLVNQTMTAEADEILICASMLNASGDLFLDGMTLDEARRLLAPKKLTVVANNGAALYHALSGLGE
jgi:putative radical SAM enzyme (TIGR03279 family)